MYNKQRPEAHLPSLDGLRGLAILLVLCCHIVEPFQVHDLSLFAIQSLGFAGWTGVDLFFVLSGFLITGILWESRSAPHYFRNFYARRTLRLFPLYYGTLIAMFLIVPALLRWLPDQAVQGEVGDRMRELKDTSGFWLWYFTYSVDVLVALKGFVFPSHFWTLAVEEHFYLVWPVVVRKLTLSALISVSWMIVFLVPVLRCCLASFVAPVALYVLTPCRMDSLALGALIALTLRMEGGLERLHAIARLSFPASIVFCIGLMGLDEWSGFGYQIMFTTGWSQYGYIAQTIGYSVTGMFYASILVLVLSEKRWASAFSGRTLRFFGKYSYGLYVLHVFAFHYTAKLFWLGDPSRFSLLQNMSIDGVVLYYNDRTFALILDGICYAIVAVGLSVLLSLVSWRLLELPFLRLKRAFPYDNRNHDGSDLVIALAQDAHAISAPDGR